MTFPNDRLLSAALRSAERRTTEEQRHGRLLWSAEDGTRCFQRQDPDAGVLTIAFPGGDTTVYELVGVDMADLA